MRSPFLLISPSTRAGPNKQLKFELTFGHFCDAIADVARARYPSLPPQSALRCFHDNHLAPLFTELFGQETDESVLNTSGSAIGDGGGAGQPSLTRRDTRLVLTTEGTLPRQASFAVAGPALSMSVHEQYLPTDKTARYEIKLNSSNHTPSQSRNGSGTVSSSSSIANHTDFVTTSGSAAVGATAQPWAGAAAQGIAAGGRFLRSAVSAQDLIASLNYGDAPTSSNSSVVHVMGKQGSYVDPTSTRTEPTQPAATSPGGTSSVVSAADFAAVLQQLQAQILNVQSLTDANARLTSENAELRSALAAAGARR